MMLSIIVTHTCVVVATSSACDEFEFEAPVSFGSLGVGVVVVVVCCECEGVHDDGSDCKF